MKSFMYFMLISIQNLTTTRAGVLLRFIAQSTHTMEGATHFRCFSVSSPNGANTIPGFG